MNKPISPTADYAYVKRSRIELAELGITGYVIAAFKDGRALIVRPGILHYNKTRLPPKIEPQVYPDYESAFSAIIQTTEHTVAQDKEKQA